MFKNLIGFGFPEDMRFPATDDAGDLADYTPAGGDSDPPAPVSDQGNFDVDLPVSDPEPVVDPTPVADPAPAPEPTPEERMTALETKLLEANTALTRQQAENELTRGFMERVQREAQPAASAQPAWHFNAEDEAQLAGDPNLFIKMINAKFKAQDEYYDQAMTARSNQRVTQESAQQNLAKVFYGTNPDLVGKEDLVGLVSQKVYQADPRAPQDVILKNIADGVRAKLKEWGATATPKARTKGSPTRTGGRARPRDPGEPSELAKTLAHVEKRKS